MNYRLGSLLLLGTVTCGTLFAQGLTIPDALARHGASLSGGRSIPSGPPPTLEQILAETDTVVTGVVGMPVSVLSTDQMDVYTEYPVRDSAILYQRTMPRFKQPQMPSVTVTVLGGVITLNGLTYTSRHESLPSLTPGERCLFLLKSSDSRYFLAGTFYGVFRIDGPAIVPLTRHHGFADELRQEAAPQAIEAIIARVRAMHASGV